MPKTQRTRQSTIPLMIQLRSVKLLLLALFLALFLSGCAATRSEIKGSYALAGEKNIGAEPVSVFFLFKHFTQEKGFDAIPKLKYSDTMKVNNVQENSFDNILRDSLNELSNISKYETFTEVANDVNVPERRDKLKDLRTSHNFTIEIQILEESSFKQQAFSALISTISATLIPMPYTWDYTMTAYLYDQKSKLLRSYERKASLDNWVEFFLMFAYPFYPLEGKREEIYSGFLHDLFKQIESEKILKL